MFRRGDFVLHSGDKSIWLIDCEVLTDEDWDTLAAIVVYEYGIKFREVFGIPKGGLKFAEALIPYRAIGSRYPILIVDDVLTTGQSMEEVRKICLDSIGVVVFARGKCPDWIRPIFQYQVKGF